MNGGEAVVYLPGEDGDTVREFVSDKDEKVKPVMQRDKRRSWAKKTFPLFAASQAGRKLDTALCSLDGFAFQLTLCILMKKN